MQLKNLKSGQKFLFEGKLFIKINCYGDLFGASLCKDQEGNSIAIEADKQVQKVIET